MAIATLVPCSPYVPYKNLTDFGATPHTPPCKDMVPKSLALLGLLLLSHFVCGSTASSPDQFSMDDAAWCAGLGGSAIDTLANFRLYAWKKDQTNDNSTGVPLVLATTGTTATAYSHTLVVSVQLERLIYFEASNSHLLRRLWNRTVMTEWPISQSNEVVSRPTLRSGQSP